VTEELCNIGNKFVGVIANVLPIIHSGAIHAFFSETIVGLTLAQAKL